jgi:colanic acid/amylovoran biosynthesis glycosyltransferase
MNHTILVYRNQPLPISETFVYNQCFRLKRYQVYVLGSKRPRGSAIPLPPDRVRVLNTGGRDGLWREFRCKVLGQIPSDILHWAQALQPVLLHAHFGPDGAIAMPLAKALGIPLIVSFHGTDATMKDSAVWRHSHMAHRLYLLRRRRLAQAASRVIVQSDFLRRIVIERHGFPEEKVVMIRYGVDLDLFQPHVAQREWGHILYVGRLVERKGLHYLLVALGKVKERFPTVRLTVIGDGPMRGRYEALARQILGDRCTFLGAQPQQVVREYMSKAYVFCMPSVTMPSGEAETLGMVFLEAMAMRVPPVSFRSGGIPEVIVHEETGFLAEEKNVDQLAHYLTLLLEDPALRNRMGEAGRRRVEQEFNLEKQNAKLEALYDEVIAEYAHV